MQLRKRIRHLFQPKALVLMYHRIAEIKTDPWQLAVTPSNFEQQLQVLNKSGKLISVKEMVSSLEKKKVANGSICLTFDDGYSDNYLFAKPLLEKFKTPATFFIPGYYIGLQQQFWWDELEIILLHYQQLPAIFSIHVTGTLIEFDLAEDSILSQAKLTAHECWVWPEAPPTRRCELYLTIWETIRPLPFAELQLILNQIRSWASFKKTSGSESFPMTHEQLKETCLSRYIDIGLHTETHPALAFHSKKAQYLEIAGNKKTLESVCAKPFDTLAYPYGNYNDTTLVVAREAGIMAAFTTAEKIVSNLTDPLQIGRFQVRNLTGNNFEEWLLKIKTSPQFL